MLIAIGVDWKRRSRQPRERFKLDAASCLRLVRALCAEIHEAWLEAHIYLNMQNFDAHNFLSSGFVAE